MHGLRSDEDKGLSRRALIGRGAALGGAALLGSATLGPRTGLGALSAAVTSGNGGAIEAVTLGIDDFGPAPKRFVVDGTGHPLQAGFTWGYMGRRKITLPPVTHIRTFTPGSFTNLALNRNAKSPLANPTPLHCDTFAGAAAYEQISGPAPEGPKSDPYHFRQQASAPDGSSALYRYSSRHARIIEKGAGGAPFLDVTYDHLPFAMVINPAGPKHPVGGAFAPYFGQMSHVHGTYAGAKVSYLGGMDRLFAGAFPSFLGPELFVGLFFAGVHRDGSREWGFTCIVGKKGVAMYCKEGRADRHGRRKTERITTDEVKLRSATWKVMDKDGLTPVFTSASWKFAGKVIDYDARWGFSTDNGCKGFSAKPARRSNTTGLWRERGSSSDFVKSLAFSESHASPEQVGLPVFPAR